MLDAIEDERGSLEPMKGEADVVIDTTDLNVHQLKARLVDLFGVESPAAGMQTAITSFGYKHGLPLDVDIVLDCRFLPNPYWVERLRDLTGLDEPVREYVLTQPATGAFLDKLDDLFDLLLPAYAAEGKSYLTVGIGCTGGRHRSVVIAEELAPAPAPHGLRAPRPAPRCRPEGLERRRRPGRRPGRRRGPSRRPGPDGQ